jgi:hypothetical protein
VARGEGVFFAWDDVLSNVFLAGDASLDNRAQKVIEYLFPPSPVVEIVTRKRIIAMN